MLTAVRSAKNTIHQTLSLPVLLLLTISSFGLAGCSGVVSGNSGQTGGSPVPQNGVTITNVQASAATVSGFQVSWATNVPATSEIDYGTSAAYGSSTPVNPAMVTTHQMALAGLTVGTSYHYRVRSSDANNNTVVSGDQTFATTGSSSTPFLTVSITTPANGATVSAMVVVSANATDNVSVPSVQFQLDGANLGSSITASPYNFSWNTTTASNGSHTLRAVAKDATGQASTSSSVTVTVNNSTPDTTPPSVPTGLAATAISSSQINLSWNASTDNVGVTGYNVYRGGTSIGTNTTTSYSDTGVSPSSTYSYTVAAFDAAGNTSAQSASASATTPASSTGGGLPTSLGWYQIPNTQFAPLCPSGQLGSCSAVAAAWSGGIADTKRNRLLFTGGGHADYSGNEVYALDLNALQMLRLNNPDPPSSCVDTDASGNPNSRHTYGGLTYVRSLDQMYMHGGALSCDNGATVSVSTFTLNLSTLTWSQKDPVKGTPVTQDCCNYQSFAAYDPNTDAVYYADLDHFWKYVPSTNTQTQLNFTSQLGGSSGAVSAVIDPVHKLFLTFGSGQIWSADLTAGTAVLNEIDAQTTGCGTLANSSYPGLAFDTVQNLVVAWTGGGSVITYNPVAKSCATVNFSGGPGAAQANGTFGRWQYFPALGVFALVNDWQQNAWVLRMTPATGTGGGSGPNISAVNVSSITTNSASLSWTTDVASTTQVEYGTTTAYGNLTPLNSSLVTSHTQALSGLTAGTLYHYRVHSKNSSGVESISSDSAFATNSGVNTPPPTVSMTAPTAGATVSGTITLSASASSGIGISSIQFIMDGAKLNSAVTSNPYQTSWDTTTAANGSHLLAATATDTSGNTATAIAVSVTVSNSTGAAVSFATRCAAPGVVKCVSFDSDSDMQTGPEGGPTEQNLGGPQTMFPACDGVYRFARDTSVFAEGVSSLRFDIPANSTCANEAGQYTAFMGGFFAPTAPPATNGKDLYVQFKARIDSGWLATTNGNGRKLLVMEGINPQCGTMTFVQENSFNVGYLKSYTDCGGNQMYNPAGTVTTSTQEEQGDFAATCHYGDTSGSNCLQYAPGQWMTFYYHIQLDGWSDGNTCGWSDGCTGVTLLEAWAAVDPGPLKKWLSIPNYAFHCDSVSPCTTNSNDAMSRLTFEVYDTGHTIANNIPGTVWYDSLIISAKPILAPYGPTP